MCLVILLITITEELHRFYNITKLSQIAYSIPYLCLWIILVFACMYILYCPSVIMDLNYNSWSLHVVYYIQLETV